MGVVEVLEAAGSFSISMNSNMPRSIIETTIDYFGHIAIIPGRVNPQALGDNLLNAARYVGVLRKKSVGDQIVIEGGGMILWLGDQDDKGSVFENATIFSSAGFATVIRGLLPPEITEGTLYPVPGLLTQTFHWESPRTAIQFTCDTMFAEFRVNNNGTLDAGPASSLYVTTPKCIIVRKNSGQDMKLAGLPGHLEATRDVEDFSTRVVIVSQVTGVPIGIGHADIAPASNPYKDIHGNTLKRTRLVSESGTPLGLASTRAQLQLNKYTSLNNAISLSALGSEYDIKGEFNVGDTVWVYDPDSGLYDTAQEVTFRGQRINPIALRVIEADWPIVQGMTVAYRDRNGVWTDLTDYVQFETGDVTVVVGNVNRTLLTPTSGYQPTSQNPTFDLIAPGVPAFNVPFTSAVYTDGNGMTKAKMSVRWTAPLNTDGTTVTDGNHYEIRYAVDTQTIYPSPWANLAVDRWQDLGTWGQPFAYPDGGLWNIAFAPWPDSSIIINDLSCGVGYDFQIRLVDSSGNQGAWSGTTTAITLQDNIPPSAPAPPTVASSRIAIQVSHTLGKASGGTFNLESDMDHLNVHVGTGADFYPDDNSTLVGRLKATGGMINGSIPAIGTFNIESTIGVWVKVVAVDVAGNKSVASASVQATALLIDDQHISNLTVTKVTAGTISADWIVGSRIKTADTGARVELSSSGFQAFDSSGSQTVTINSADGSATILGKFASGFTGPRLVINPNGTGIDPEIRFYIDDTKYHYFTTFSGAGPQTLQIGTPGDINNLAGYMILNPGSINIGIFNNATGVVNNQIALNNDGSTSFTGQLAGNLVYDIEFQKDGSIMFANDSAVVDRYVSFYNLTASSGLGSAFRFACQGLPGPTTALTAYWNGSLNFVNDSTNVIVKTFIIDHPVDSDKYLIHATTESPHNGIEYWGTGKLDESGMATIELPEYFEALTAKKGRAVFLTPILGCAKLSAGLPFNGKFTVDGYPGGSSFSWLVKAIRKDVPALLVEPRKTEVNVHGNGPYKFYTMKEK